MPEWIRYITVTLPLRCRSGEMPEWIQWASSLASMIGWHESHAHLCRFVLQAERV